METNTGPAGMVSNSGVSDFAASAGEFGMSLRRSLTGPSAAGPDLLSAAGGLSFFSSGFRPRDTTVDFPSKVVSLNVRALALDAAALVSAGSTVSVKRTLPIALSRDETLSALTCWLAGVLSAIHGSSFFA